MLYVNVVFAACFPAVAPQKNQLHAKCSFKHVAFNKSFNNFLNLLKSSG